MTKKPPRRTAKKAVHHMTKKPPGFHSLSRRIVLQFSMFSLVICALYGFISFVLMYTLEDSFIEKEMLSEGDFVVSQFAQTGEWPLPRTSTMQLHFNTDSFPEDIRQQFINTPREVEFYGDQGRHYHVYRLPDHESVWLIAEVSDELLVRQIRGGVIVFLAVSGSILTSLACLVAWIIGRRTAKPLKDLAELVDGVAPEQIPNTFAHHFPNNEIGILARTLEAAFLRINQALEREKHFTRDVSHELRTPLAVIKNALELRQSQQRDALQTNSVQTHSPQEKQSNDNAIIYRVTEAAEQMDKTVSALLMLAREENTSAKKQSVNLMSLVEQAVLDNSLLLEGKEVEVDIDDSCSSQLDVQPGMVKVLLDNLLSNAFQYTQQGQVRVYFDTGKLVVEDTGPGIEADISNNLTDSGIKGSQSTGFGFGLSIVKRLCEHQGWQFSLESEQGTKVSVLLVPGV